MSPSPSAPRFTGRSAAPFGKGPAQTDADADAAARLLAQREFTHPLVVEAGAGTGKTATLVARILAWTVGPGWDRARADLLGRTSFPPSPDDVALATMRGVLAITFTDAASAEMAARVGQGMLGLARGQLPTGLDPNVLPADPNVVARRADALLGALDALEVRTIHAFCARLLQEQAIAAGLHPAFDVDADGLECEAVATQIVTQALSVGLGDPADPDLLALLAQGVAPAELVVATTAFLQAAVDPSDLAGDPVAAAAVAQLGAALGDGLRRLARALDGLRGMKRATRLVDLWHALTELLDDLPQAPSFDVARQVAQALSNDHPRALKNLRAGKLGKTESAALDDPAAAIAQGQELVELLDFVAALDPDALRRAMRVIAPLLASAHEALRARGSLSFGELLVRAATLLDEQPAVRQRVRAGLRQVLVDEFQDTDPRQCRIVAALALDGPPAQRPGLFIVGDPKQSIYGWRSADLQAYDDFVERVIAAGGQRVFLVVNFRSVPAVLQAVQGAMEPVMRAEPGRQPAFQALLPGPGLADQPGFSSPGGQAPVELWATWVYDGAGAGAGGGAGAERQPAARQTKPQVRQLEASSLARDLVALSLSGVRWRDIAVLFRSSSDLPTLVAALRDAGVPYAVERDRSYFLRREISDATSLLAVTLAPHDQVALVGWLRSATVGVPDAALLPLWRARLPQIVAGLDGGGTTDWTRIDQAVAQAAEEVAAIHPQPPGLDRVQGWDQSLCDALRRIALLRRAYRDLPVDRFVAVMRRASLVEQTEASRYQGPWRLANLDRFFRGVLDALRKKDDVNAVLRQLRQGLAGERQAEEGRPQEAAQDAVQLMTIHKSKGLGFQHVYVVGLDKRTGRSAPPRTVVHDAQAWRLFGLSAPGFLAFSRRARAVAQAERVRLLYVAMTRAKQRLVLTGTFPAAGSPVPLNQARTPLDLLTRWTSVPPDLADRFAALPAEQDRWSGQGVSWVAPGRRDLPKTLPRGGVGVGGTLPAPGLVPLARVRADASKLQAARAAAQRRMARPWTQGPSALAHLTDRADAADGSSAPGLSVLLNPALHPALDPGVDPRAVATVAGTAVHGVLQRLVLDAADAELALQDAAADLEQRIAPRCEPAVLGPALARARALLAQLRGGRLLRRLFDLGINVLARELPILLPPDDAQGPVGAVVGTVDMVFLDRPTDRLVVVDFKTDLLDPDSLFAAARVAAYARQLQPYLRALAQALELTQPPRGELWFLVADQVVGV